MYVTVNVIKRMNSLEKNPSTTFFTVNEKRGFLRKQPTKFYLLLETYANFSEEKKFLILSAYMKECYKRRFGDMVLILATFGYRELHFCYNMMIQILELMRKI